MRLGRRRRGSRPSTETVGRVVITYNSGRSGPNSIVTVRKADFDRLVNVIQAYQVIASVRGELRSHPTEQVRSQARDLLGMAQSKTQPTPRKAFTLQTYTVKGRWPRMGRLCISQAVTLSPWLMRGANLVEQSQVLPPADSIES